MADGRPLREGQVLTGPLFNEPMRVETVRPSGPDTWIAGPSASTPTVFAMSRCLSRIFRVSEFKS